MNRTATIESFAHLVPTTVARLGTHLQQADEDDLTSALYLALVNAVDGYNPAKGATMKTHLVGRLRFAVAEWFRNRGGVVSKTGWRTRKALHRGEPVSARQAADLAAMQNLERPLNIDEIIVQGDETFSAEAIADPRPGPEQLTLDLFDREEAQAMLRVLPRREREAMRRYYILDETHQQIGAAFGVGTTYAARIRATGEARLRAFHGQGPMPYGSRVADNLGEIDLSRRIPRGDQPRIAARIGCSVHGVKKAIDILRAGLGIKPRPLREEVFDLATAHGVIEVIPTGWHELAGEVLGVPGRAVRSALHLIRREQGIKPRVVRK